MKKTLAFILSLCFILSSVLMPVTTSLAQAQNSEQVEAMQRMMDLGIFTSTTVDKMDLARAVTREELASILVQVNGQQDKLSFYKNSSLYSDVPRSRWSNAPVQAAVKLGYMTAMPDGKFHPTDKITFAQVATILGKLLKYDETNLTGSYPANYMIQLSDLGLFDGIEYTVSGTVTRGQLAMILDKFFQTEVYGTDKTFADTLSNYQWGVVLDNSIIHPNEEDRRVITDKGFFFLKAGLKIPEAGKKYLFRLKGNEIQYQSLVDLTFSQISVLSINNGNITTHSGERITAPASISYYYGGKETSYNEVSTKIQTNSSLVIGYDGNEEVYGALFDPKYSEPKVISASLAGAALEIQYGSYTIEKEGKYIEASQIEANDVVYEVTDLWGKNGYVLVYDQTVSGKITAILPNKVSPTTLEMDGKSYSLDTSFPKEKLTATGANQVGETARIILGSEGTVVDILSDTLSGTENHALVLNAYTLNSVKTEDFGTPYYYVTLLCSDGAKIVYRANSSQVSLRGKLVTYEIIARGIEEDTVQLTAINYDSVSGSYRVNKEERMLGESYVANGAVLFNIRSTASAEIDAAVISFNDLPSGTLMDGKVNYMHKSGAFTDIDMMVLNNALEENVAYGIATAKKTSVNQGGSNETVTFMVNGQTMTYTTKEAGVFLNSPAKLTLNGNTVTSIEYALSAAATDNEIEAVDASRIKLDGKVYTYHKNLTIYGLKDDATWNKLEISDLSKGNAYRSVSVYLDKPVSYGGKVVMILLR